MTKDYRLQTMDYPKTFIFIGRSGSGKGTQVELLKKYLSEKDSARNIFAVETGEKFRSFLASGTYAGGLSKEIMEKGELQPEFLAVYMWADEMIKKMTGEENLILDGSPRRLREAYVLDTALQFFKREKPCIVHINVSSEWAREKLKKRGRADDIDLDDVEKRLAWFEAEVKPALEWFRTNPYYQVFDINGEQTIEDVYSEMIMKMFNV